MKKKNSFCVLLLTGVLTFSFVCVPKVDAITYNASININTTYQTLEGFGASSAWNQSSLTSHPNKREIYDTLFQGLGLDILRIRNQYRNNPKFDYETTEIVKTAGLSLGHPIKVFLDSWTPPADLKKNGVLNGGTLIKENGTFVYSKFADYWYNSLKAYEAKGIVPEYISIQNEPDYENSTWETCIFRPTEDTNYPGFGIALNAVYNKLLTMDNPPKILGAEATGLGSNKVQDYSNNMNLNQVYGIAHHLYNGGDPYNPDSFITNMKAIATAYPSKPLFMTEYDKGSAFNTAQLIHNSLVEEGVSSYMFWDLIWDNSQRPLVVVENPSNASSWTYPKGYAVTDNYYVMKQYSKFTDPGYKRVQASTDLKDVKMSAFISPDQKQLTAIIINQGSAESTLNLDLNGYSIGSSAIYRTIVDGTDKFASVGSLGSDNTVTLPAKSVTTVVMNPPGYTPPVDPSPLPIPTQRPETISAYQQIESESYTSQSGIQADLIDDNGNHNVGYIQNNDYTAYSGVDFKNGTTQFQARVSSNGSGGNIEIRLDGQYNPTIAKIPVPVTGGWSVWNNITANISGLTGKHDLYLVYTGASGYLFNMDWFKFIPTNTESIGDVNGDGSVNIFDYVMMKKYISGTINDFPANDDLWTGDVNGDGKINIIDLIVVKHYLSGSITEFPKK